MTHHIHAHSHILGCSIPGLIHVSISAYLAMPLVRLHSRAGVCSWKQEAERGTAPGSLLPAPLAPPQTRALAPGGVRKCTRAQHYTSIAWRAVKRPV